MARILTDRVRTGLGQPLIVDNQAGGNTVIGTQNVARAKPDGYTILQMAVTNVIVAGLQKNVPYDLERDFTPVIGVGAVPMALAVPAKSNIRGIADLTATAKSLPGGITYASGGTASLTHLAAARLVQELKISATHVPFRGGSGAMQAVLGNQVQFIFVSTVAATEFAKHGDFRLLAVTSEQRVRSFPDVPTMVEQGFADFTPMLWYGYVVPAKTPTPIVDRLYDAFAKAANDPGTQQRLGDLGLTVRIRSGADFGRYMGEESVRWRRVISENNIRME